MDSQDGYKGLTLYETAEMLAAIGGMTIQEAQQAIMDHLREQYTPSPEAREAFRALGLTDDYRGPRA